MIKQYKRQLFVTTYSLPMKDTLTRAGFQHVGKEWKGKKEMLSLWMKT